MTAPPFTPPVHDAAAMAVLADALLAQGDARGEVMALQLALEARPHDKALARQVERALALHAKALLGRLSTRQTLLTLEWTRGYVTRARVAGSTSAERLEATARELLSLPSARALELLTLVLPNTPQGVGAGLRCAQWLTSRGTPRAEITLEPVEREWHGCDCRACLAERPVLSAPVDSLVTYSATCEVHPLLLTA